MYEGIPIRDTDNKCLNFNAKVTHTVGNSQSSNFTLFLYVNEA